MSATGIHVVHANNTIIGWAYYPVNIPEPAAPTHTGTLTQLKEKIMSMTDLDVVKTPEGSFIPGQWFFEGEPIKAITISTTETTSDPFWIEYLFHITMTKESRFQVHTEKEGINQLSGLRSF